MLALVIGADGENGPGPAQQLGEASKRVGFSTLDVHLDECDRLAPQEVVQSPTLDRSGRMVCRRIEAKLSGIGSSDPGYPAAKNWYWFGRDPS